MSALDSILRTLEEKRIKAEFYVLGSEVKQYPEAARTIVRQGHLSKTTRGATLIWSANRSRMSAGSLSRPRNLSKLSPELRRQKFVRHMGREVFAATSIRSWSRLRGNWR